MKIIQANKFYYPRGGADMYVLELSQLLSDAGHEVIPFAMHHPENRKTPYTDYFVSEMDLKARGSWWQDIKKFGRVVYSLEARRKFAALIRATKPDIIHIHNIYHQISPSILQAARAAHVPVVMTLHDYKLLNPNYSMLGHGGQICEHSANGRYVEVLKYNCMGSRGASFAVMMEAYLHAWLGSYRKTVRRYISPSRFMIDLAARRGIAREKLVHIPNFVRPLTPPKTRGKECALYFGRLSREKGLMYLLEAAKMIANIPVVIVGRGSEEAELRSRAGELGLKNVTFVGFKHGAELWHLVAGARVVVMPTISFENAPLAILEAQSLGKITIVTAQGGLPELVRNGENGYVVPPADSLTLAKTIEMVWNMSDAERGAMEGVARERVMREHNPEDHLRRIVALYKSVIL